MISLLKMITIIFCTFFILSQIIDKGEFPSFVTETQKLLSSSEAEYKTNEDELLKALLSAGMLRNYPLSYVLASQSASELLMGNFSRAEKLYTTASYISPDLPAVHYIYANALKDTGITGTFKSFIPFFNFVILKYSNTFSYEELKVTWLNNLFIFVLLITSIVSLAVLIKNLPAILHFFNEIFGFLLPEWGINTSIFLLLLLPISFKISPGYLIPSYLTFFTIFTRKGESGTKVLAFIILILFGSLELIGKKISTYFDPARVEHLTFIYNYHSGQWNKELFSMESNEKEKEEKLFVKGLLFIKIGEYEKAKLIFEELLKKGYYREKCLNNLGIVEYALGNQAESENYFRQAIKTSELIPEAHYNLSIIYFSQAKLEEGKEELEIAKSVLPQTIERISRFTSRESINLLFIPSELHPDEFMMGFKTGINPEAYREIMKRLFGRSPQNKSIVISIICGAIILLFQIPILRKYLPNFCKRCGRVYCSLCDESPLENECGLCYTIYILKEKIPPEERIKFEIETSKRYYRKRWLVIISNIILPGMGYIIGDKNIRGFLLLSLWILLFEPLIISEFITRGLMPFSVEISFLEIASIVFIAFIVWILTVFRMRSWR
jgi:tetratricopeptide (TPR) repeat protein